MDKLIHHLIAFPAAWLEAEKMFKEAFNGKGDKKRMKEFKKNKELYHAWTMGGRHRGSFLDRDKLVGVIKASNDPYGICECYYEYLLIETHVVDEIDSCLFSPDNCNETWFKYTKIDEDTWEYQEIPRPECLKGTCNFL